MLHAGLTAPRLCPPHKFPHCCCSFGGPIGISVKEEGRGTLKKADELLKEKERAIAEGRLPDLGGVGWVTSLVPTQLERLLGGEAGRRWLARFAVVHLGGGPAWPALLEAAAGAGIRLSPGYGMTETAAMVFAVRPGDFLAGDRTSGRALPHARGSLSAEGTVVLEAGSLFRGYWPGGRAAGPLVTEDLGAFDAQGRLTILGRRDAVIITGGEKVDPFEVEVALRATGQFGDVAVVGVPDARWGRRVVAVYAGGGRAPDAAAVEAGLAGLAAYKRPKALVALTPWPRSAQGKVNRAELERRAAEGGMEG